MNNVYGSLKTYEDLVEKLNNNKKVFFTRFGDNDIMMISGTGLDGNPLGSKRYGGNRTQWSLALQKDLLRSFTIDDPRYMIAVSGSWEHEDGMRDGVFAGFPYKDKLMQKVRMYTKQEQFYLPILFHYMITFQNEKFKSFCEYYLHDKKKMFIGSVSKQAAEKILGKIDYYVKTPMVGAYESIEQCWPIVKKLIETKEIDLVIPNCGQATRALQGRLWDLDKDIWSLDMGSIFDPIEGRNSRTCWKEVGHKIRENYI